MEPMQVIAVAGTALGALLPITNPVGALAAYAGLTGDMPATEVRRQATRTGLYVFGILAAFTLFGTLVLNAFGITLGALQVAGGLVVAHSGFGMITSTPRLDATEQDHARAKQDISFSPMALPLIAGPGAIGVVIALTARHPGWGNRIGVVVAAAVISALIVLVLRFGTPVVDRLGPTGIGALVRIIGFLILAIGVEILVHGLQSLHVI
jgi:multiple antibiotic resistance protein